MSRFGELGLALFPRRSHVEGTPMFVIIITAKSQKVKCFKNIF